MSYKCFEKKWKILKKWLRDNCKKIVCQGMSSYYFRPMSHESSKSVKTNSSLTDMEKLLLRSKYNLEVESLQFKYLVAQETIVQLRQELKQKEILHLKQQNSGGIFNPLNPYRWILEKIQNAAPSPSAFCGKKIQSAAFHHFVNVPMFWNFFSESAIGDCPKKSHIFLFSTAYFRTYWHMPFKIYITI